MCPAADVNQNLKTFISGIYLGIRMLELNNSCVHMSEF